MCVFFAYLQSCAMMYSFERRLVGGAIGERLLTSTMGPLQNPRFFNIIFMKGMPSCAYCQ